MERILRRIGWFPIVVAVVLPAASGCKSTDDAADASRRALSQGDRFLAKGLYEEAETEYVGALRRNPEDGAITYRLGKVCLRTDREQEAGKWLRRTLELGPNARIAAEAHYHLRELHAVSGETIDAMESRNRLLKQLTTSGDLDAHRAAVWAACLANDECQDQWDRRPFSPDSFACEKAQGKWHWGQMDPAGVRGFSAIVSFEADGSKPSVEVFFSSDRGTPMQRDLQR
jgi:tetratricopeptide (TPR) repeat protein